MLIAMVSKTLRAITVRVITLAGVITIITIARAMTSAWRAGAAVNALPFYIAGLVCHHQPAPADHEQHRSPEAAASARHPRCTAQAARPRDASDT